MPKTIVLTNAWTGLPIAFNVDNIVGFTPVEPKPENEKAVPGAEYGPKLKPETYIMTCGNDDGGYPIAETFEEIYKRVTAA